MATYTFHFNPNPPDGSTENSIEKEEEINEFPYLFLYRAKNLNISYTGYKFVKWNDAADGSGTSLYYGDEISVSSQMDSIVSKTWYAIWEEDFTYYLTTDAELAQVASAIRAKIKSNTKLVYPTGFANAIQTISGAIITNLYYDGHKGYFPMSFENLLFNCSTTNIKITICKLTKTWQSDNQLILFYLGNDIGRIESDNITFYGSGINQDYYANVYATFNWENDFLILTDLYDVNHSVEMDINDWNISTFCIYQG